MFNFKNNSNTSNVNALDNDLSILIGIDRFVYMISDQNNQIKKLFANSYEKRFQTGLYDILKVAESDVREDAIFAKMFNDVKISVSNTPFVIVPRSVSDKVANEKLLMQSTNVPEEMHVMRSPIYNKMDVIYTVEEKLVDSLNQSFKKYRFGHNIESIIVSFGKLVSVANDNVICVNVEANYMQLLVFKKETLIFANEFKINSASDLLYHVMLCFELMDFNPKLTPVVLSGLVDEDSENYKLLYQYIQNLKHIEIDANQFNAADKKVSFQKINCFDIISSRLCEL